MSLAPQQMHLCSGIATVRAYNMSRHYVQENTWLRSRSRG